MANIIIAGNACVVTSALTSNELKRLKKYAPAALILKDEDKKPIFMVDFATKGSVSPTGIVFNGTAHDGTEKATLTMEMPQDVGDVERWVIDTIGTSINKLNQLEGTLGEALAKIDADEAAIVDSICVIGAEG